jgi:hypothetical protein
MTPEGPTQIVLAEFRIIAEHIGTRDLVQEFLAFKIFPTMKEWVLGAFGFRRSSKTRFNSVSGV